jgi:pimeloyl-ACP methyl ester carboxylesterase
MARRAFFLAKRCKMASRRALAVDIVAFMDALKIDKAILTGFDWGARTANIIAALWPERCRLSLTSIVSD